MKVPIPSTRDGRFPDPTLDPSGGISRWQMSILVNLGHTHWVGNTITIVANLVRNSRSCIFNPLVCMLMVLGSACYGTATFAQQAPVVLVIAVNAVRENVAI
jgi:hypothetical protein